MHHLLEAVILASGISLQLYAFGLVLSFVRSIPKGNSIRGWQTILVFVGLFIVGCVYAFFLVLAPGQIEVPMFVALVFLAGALFTIICIRTGVRFSKTLLQMNGVLQKTVDEKTRELKERNQQLESFINNSPDGIVVMDQDGKIATFNNQAQVCFGFSENEVIGKPIEILVPSGLHSMGGGINLVAQRKNGSTFPVEISVSPVPVQEKTLVMATVRDISERKAAERKIAEQSNQLALASKLAASGKFAGGIAHELNTPLGVIQLLGEQILEAGESEIPDLATIRNNAHGIADMVKKSAKIIKALLAFARSGPQENTGSFSMRELIEESLFLSRGQFDEEKVELKMATIPVDLRGYGKFSQLSQVIYALLDNACKAAKTCPEKWVQLDVGEKGGITEIAIMDSGPGVPPQIREHIFDPFFTTREIGQGPGLGLSLSFGIIEQHGGALFLDRANARTRFVIHLPIAARTALP